jgi:hypothetical protein
VSCSRRTHSTRVTTGSLVPDEGMPADPFREGQPDWSGLAACDVAFLSAHLAAGMAEAHAVELTKTYLTFMLGVILASQQQEQQQGEPREACE